MIVHSHRHVLGLRQKVLVAALLVCVGVAVGLVQIRAVANFDGLLVYGLLLCLLTGFLAFLLSGRKWVRLVLFAILFPFMVAVNFTWSAALLGITLYRVASPSMEPAIPEGSLIIVEQRGTGTESSLSRCDIIAFEHHGSVYVKRLVGLPLDQVETRPGGLYVNGEVSGCSNEGSGLSVYGDASWQVPEGHVFVLGDNHGRSEDSRTFGPISEDLVLGRISDVLR